LIIDILLMRQLAIIYASRQILRQLSLRRHATPLLIIDIIITP